MNIKKMKDLREVVKSIPPKKFCMARWANECKTKACAAGHYAMRYPRRLKLVPDPFSCNCDDYTRHEHNNGICEHASYTVIHARTDNEEVQALMDEFEISEDDASRIFLNTTASKKEVLARIDRYIKVAEMLERNKI